MEPPSLPEPAPEREPLRRSTRNCNKGEAEEKNSKYEPDSFSDPRRRIRSPELLERLNDFLWDIGTDPEHVDVNFPDLSASFNQARVFYVPKLEDVEQSIVPQNKVTGSEGNDRKDMKAELAVPEKISTVKKGDIEQSVIPKNEKTRKPERRVQADVKPELAPVVVEDDQNDRLTNRGREGITTRARNALSNCIAI